VGRFIGVHRKTALASLNLAHPVYSSSSYFILKLALKEVFSELSTRCWN